MAAKKTTTKRAPRATRTRKDLDNDLEAIQREQADAEEDEQDTTSAIAARARAANIKQLTAGLTPETAVERLMKAKLDANRALDGVGEQLVAEAEQLTQVREAIENERKELETLLDKEVISSSIKSLLDTFESEKTRIDEATANIEKQYADRVADLEAEFKDAKAELEKQHKREEADYQYNLAQTRKKQLDKFAEEDRTRSIAEAERFRLQELNWSTREEALKKAEQELADLRAKAAGFDELVKKEVAKEVAIATNSLKKDFTHAAQMEQAKFEAATQIANNKAAAQQATIGALSAQIDALNLANTNLQAQLKEISTTALNSASGQAALTALQTQLANGGQSTSKSAKA